MAPFPLRPFATSRLRAAATCRREVSVNTQASFANADGDDGLVDATYYFTIPVADRTGTLEILPSRTSGMRYENFHGVGTTTLVTGGPVRVALHFPKPVAAATKAPRSRRRERRHPAPYHDVRQHAQLRIDDPRVLLLIGGVYVWIRRARRRQVHETNGPSTSLTRDPRRVPAVQSEAREPAARFDSTWRSTNSFPVEPDERLHVNVLGSLTISPTDGPTSDPVRAIVAYLAMHTERPLTLDEIQNAIWPLTDKGNDIKRPAMRNYMANARKAVGEIAPAHRFGTTRLSTRRRHDRLDRVPESRRSSRERGQARSTGTSQRSTVARSRRTLHGRHLALFHLGVLLRRRLQDRRIDDRLSPTRSVPSWFWRATFVAPSGHCAKACSVIPRR